MGICVLETARLWLIVIWSSSQSLQYFLWLGCPTRLPQQVLVYWAIALLLLASGVTLSPVCTPEQHLLATHPFALQWAHDSCFSSHNFHLQVTFTCPFMCPLVYLPLPPASQREIHTLALLPAKPSHFEIGWNGNPSAEWKLFKKSQKFLAHTESGVPACFTWFSCQLHSEEVLCVRKVLYWIKCTAQDSHNSTSVLSEVKLPAVLKDTLPCHDLFLYLSLSFVADQSESNKFAVLFLPRFWLNSGMS